jgi:hypothetical protein
MVKIKAINYRKATGPYAPQLLSHKEFAEDSDANETDEDDEPAEE